MSNIGENLKIINNNIELANSKRGADELQAKLIAVSKTKPVDMLWEAYNEGVRDFGENKVQEIMDKYDELPKDIRWHMIGHLQTNKVKYIIDKVYMIHSVESVKLATEISKRACAAGIVMPILVEVNIGDEDSKFGLKVDEVESFVREICSLPGIKISGLMCVAPYTEDAENNRVYFKRLNNLLVDITTKNIDNVSMDILSMGMSGDYMIALEEGATYVRVGTILFGERDYSITL